MSIVARLLVLLPLLWVEGVWAFECPMPLSECYVEGYPEELDIFKLSLELSAIAWVLGAVSMSAFNLFSIWRKRGRND